MIGQSNLISTINNLIEYNQYPRFSIITGNKGQGKKTVVNYIAKKLNFTLVTSDIKIDSVREIIESAYTQTQPIIYLFSDADTMSINAQNSLLKVIEEPPNNAYFILTLSQIENTLPTIRSRCQEFKMDNYTTEDLSLYLSQNHSNMNNSTVDLILLLASNIYEIEELIKYKVEDYYQYCDKVVSNIFKVPSYNVFKIADKLNLKDDSTKYDLNLFFCSFKQICFDKLLEELDVNQIKIYTLMIQITSQYQQQLKTSGINKTMLVDRWLLALRTMWKRCNNDNTRTT